jgi:hypothetical protein
MADRRAPNPTALMATGFYVLGVGLCFATSQPGKKRPTNGFYALGVGLCFATDASLAGL